MPTLRTVLAVSILLVPALRAESWPQWRGPGGSGVSPEKGLPTTWSESANVVWRAKLAGLGVSSPVVWNDRVVLTYQVGSSRLREGNHPSFVQEGNPAEAGEVPLGGARPAETSDRIEFVVAAFGASDGAPLWQHRFPAEGALPDVHEKRNLAVSSAATDGEHVYAWFSNGQLVALDMDGKLAWERHLGRDYKVFDLTWGHTSSPALYRDRLILLCYQETASWLLALDKRTGRELWKVDRPAGRKSYSTPLVIEAPKGPEIIVNSTVGLEAFDPATGQSLWEFQEETRFAVPMPLYHDGVIYTSRGYRSGPYMALRAGLRGRLSRDNLLWHVPTGAPYTSSLVYYGGLLYMAQDMGIVSCIDAATGKLVWRERLGGIYSSSPVAADGKIYLFSETGETFVLRAGRKLDLAAANRLDGRVIASPAVSGGKIYIRTDRELIALGAL